MYFKSLGTTFVFEFFEDISKYPDLLTNLKVIVDEFDDNYTRFDTRSILSMFSKYLSSLQLDQSLVDFPFERYLDDFFEYYEILDFPHIALTSEICGEFRELVIFADHKYLESGGKFDIRIGRKLFENGYNKADIFGNKNIPTEYQVNYEEYVILLDFGGFGKGYVIDKLVRYLKDSGLKYFIVNGGGDIYVTSDNEKEIEISIEDPTNTNKSHKSIFLKDQAIAISGNYKRKWSVDGIEYNHLINSTTKEIKQVYAVADTALLADYKCKLLF